MLTNVTFSVDREVLARARQRAQARKSTLNEEFRAWLRQYADPEAEERVRQFDELVQKINYASSGGRRFTRDELNERR